MTVKGRSAIEIGTEGIETDDGRAAQTGTVNAKEVAAAAGTGEMSEETKRGMEGMTGARRKTGITTKTGALRESGPEMERAGKRKRTEDIKMTGSDTETRGRPKDQVGVEAGKKGTRAEKKKAGNGSEARAERGKGTEMESLGLTDVVVVKIEVITSVSPVMITVNTMKAGDRALTEQCFSAFFLPF